MKKLAEITGIVLILSLILAIVVFLSSMKSLNTKKDSNIPYGFVPLYTSQKSSEIATLLNVALATKISPVTHGEGKAIEVVINGESHYVEEPFDEFVARAKIALARK